MEIAVTVRIANEIGAVPDIPRGETIQTADPDQKEKPTVQPLIQEIEK